MCEPCKKCGTPKVEGELIPGRGTTRRVCCPTCIAAALREPVDADDVPALLDANWEAWSRCKFIRDAVDIARNLQIVVDNIEELDEAHPEECECFGCTHFGREATTIVCELRSFVWAAKHALALVDSELPAGIGWDEFEDDPPGPAVPADADEPAVVTA
jgi:hypothetical protein